MTDRRPVIPMLAVGAALISCAPAMDQISEPITGKEQRPSSTQVAAGTPPPIAMAPHRQPEPTFCADGRILATQSSCSPMLPVLLAFERNSRSWDPAAQEALDQLVDQHRALPGSRLSIGAPSHPSDAPSSDISHVPLARALAVQEYLIARGMREEDAPFAAGVRERSTGAAINHGISNDRPIVEIRLEHDSYYRD